MFTRQKTKIKKIISLKILIRCLLYIGKKVRGAGHSSQGYIEIPINIFIQTGK